MPASTAVPGVDFANDIVARAMRAGADEAQASHVASEQFEVNFETRKITLVRTTVNESCSLSAFRDRKKGGASFNGTAEEEIAAAVRTAVEAADAGQADDANVIATPTSLPPSAHGHAQADRELMVDAVLDYLATMRERYPKICSDNSTYSFVRRTHSFANSAGVTQQEQRSGYRLGVMFSAKDGAKATSFNYTGVASYDPLEDLLAAGTVWRLIEETMRSFDPRPVPTKFVGDVIFTPDSMSDFVGVLSGALDGYTLMAGTTPYKNKQGEGIASPTFSLLNRPRSPEFPAGADFDGFGIPTTDLDVIVDGVLNEFLIDFYISRKLGRPQTAGATNFVVPPGNTPIDEIIRETERGILLARFSGGNPNSNLDFSGVAKNSFYIEDGEIKFPLIETMVSGNFQELAKQVRALSSEAVNFGGSSYPYLAASGATVSGE